MSTNISPPGRGKAWLWPVTALCILLGMLLALSLKTTRQAASEGYPTRLPALRTEFRNVKEENERLRKDVADYRLQAEQLAREQASGLSTARGLQKQLEEAKTLAGLLPVRGPGVIVTLDDSPKLNVSETDPNVIERYIVHDTDILAVCNELTSAGAEALSVNNQRLVATSGITCAGSVIMVNTRPISRPYVIKAIGDPDNLRGALTMQGRYVDVQGLDLLEMIKIEVVRQPYVSIRAYDGPTRLRYAKPIVRQAQ